MSEALTLTCADIATQKGSQYDSTFSCRSGGGRCDWQFHPWHGGTRIRHRLVGAKAAEAVGRNPGAFGRVLTLSILGMALAESIAIYALILAFQGR